MEGNIANYFIEEVKSSFREISKKHKISNRIITNYYIINDNKDCNLHQRIILNRDFKVRELISTNYALKKSIELWININYIDDMIKFKELIITINPYFLSIGSLTNINIMSLIFEHNNIIFRNIIEKKFENLYYVDLTDNYVSYYLFKNLMNCSPNLKGIIFDINKLRLNLFNNNLKELESIRKLFDSNSKIKLYIKNYSQLDTIFNIKKRKLYM